MFNQKTKNVQNKMDAESTIKNASASVSGSSSATTTATPSKGLLSFNTSNITRIFRNSTNFVQSTFGNTLLSQQSSDGSGMRSMQSLNGDSVEQTFTIPSIKKRHDASNSSMHHPKKDILSTPVLIMPTAMTNTSSLSNLSSYKQQKMLEQPASSTMGGTSSSTNTTNSIKRNKTPSNVVTNNVIVTISTADDNHKMSSSLHAQQTVSHVTESNDNHRNTNAHFNLSENIEPQNDMNKHLNSQIKKTTNNNKKTATLSPSHCQPSGAKTNNNANILFETVKMSKQQIITSIQSRSSSAKMKIQSSSMLQSHDTNNKKDEINHSKEWKNTVTSAITKSIPNQMENDESFRSQTNENGHLSPIEGNGDSERKHMNVSSYFMQTKTPSTLIVNDTNPYLDNQLNMNLQPNTNNIQMNNDAKAHIQSMSHITQTSTNMLAQAQNNNTIKGDVISKCGIDTSNNKMSNNNLDMAIITTTNENPFRSNENRLSSKSNVMENQTTTTITTTGIENIYANCVTQTNTKISNLDNYKQQDSNENVITACVLIDAASDGTVLGSNDNYNNTTNNIITNIDSSNVRNNNNNASPINQMNTMLLPSDKENNKPSQATKTNDIWTTKSQTTTTSPTTTHFMLSNLNIIAPTSTDLYDILEESDDDEHSAKLRYNRWSSTCSLYEPKNDTNFVSPSSFAAAIAFANRNPFLQLDPTAKIIEPLTIATSISTNAMEIIHSHPNYGSTMQTSLSSTPSTNNYFTPSSTLTLSNCANTIPNHFPYESYQSFVNDFIDETDFHFNGISSVSNTCTTENQITDEIMNTILCILKEYGKDDIKEFMQVICFKYTKNKNQFPKSNLILFLERSFWFTVSLFLTAFPRYFR